MNASPITVIAITLSAAAVLGWAGAALARRYALARRMFDEPGERRSHDRAVPRGGGLGIPPALLAACAGAWWLGLLAPASAAGFAGGLLIVAAAGWLEDWRTLPIVPRLVLQAAAAGWLLYWTGGMATLDLGVEVTLGPAGNLLALVACVWLINLYNFMDGIDAIAAVEGIFAGAVMGGWLLAAGEPGLSLLAMGAALACGGFLPWNLPPARLFMGDVGSTSLGYAFAALALMGEQSSAMPAVVAMLVLGVFVFDATFTVAWRMVKGARWYTPHREHAYQYLVRAGLGHGQAVCLLAAVNLVVILPVVVVLYRWPAAVGAAVAGCAGIALALWLRTRRRCAAKEEFS